MTVESDCDQQRQAEHRRFFAAAKLIAGITLLSRVAGLARDMILARFLGASGGTSNFYLAFRIPNIFRRLFGEGALAAAFVPVFSETREVSGRDGAAALLANVLGWLTALLAGLFVAIELTLLAVAWRAPVGGDLEMICTFAAIMMPFMVTICLLALGSAALNCFGHFAYPAAAPILLNLCIITGAAVVAPMWEHGHARLTVIAVSVVVAGGLQLAGVVWLLRAHRLLRRPNLRPLLPGVRKIATHMGPMLIPLGLLQINALADGVIARYFGGSDASTTVTVLGREVAKPLAAAAATWMHFGERLYQFPLGVLAISLATAVFPLFSRYAARGDMASLRTSVNRALRLAVFEGLPAGVGLILLAGPLVALIFEGRRFSAHDAAETAHLVRLYGLGIWAFCAQHIILRAYFALGDRMTPLKVACSVVLLNLALNLALIWAPAIRHGAFGLSSSITSALNVVILTALLRRRLGRLGGGALAVSVGRIALATAAMAAAVWLTQHWIAPRAGRLVGVAACVVAGAGVFAGTAALLQAPELGELLARGRGRA